ncbi:MAG: class I SAM-dependent methyltransferase [Patescibacteria group bacterium]
MDQAGWHKSKAIFKSDNAYEKFRRFYNLEHSAQKLRILDVGCGAGVMDRFLRNLGHTVIGLDIFSDGNTSHEENFIQCDINGTWPVAEKSFDYVVCLDVPEHMYSPPHVLQQSQRVLKEEGRLVFGVPNHFDLRNRLHMLTGKGIIHWDNVQYGEKAWNYAHVRFFNLKDLLQMFAEYRWYPEFMQFNFQAGGIIPTSLTPSLVRRALLKTSPALFSGKFIAGLSQTPTPTQYLYLAKTPQGL